MATSDQTPVRIGRYDVLERLAIGGMAEVFLAVEQGTHGLQRLVVVKRILPHLLQHEQMVRMFVQEARLAARISHPNVVQILELGEDDGQPYIAMEYVAGGTLKDLSVDARRLGKGMPVDVVVNLIIQSCAGAHAAHELRDPSGKPAGLVHRDLSPHNLIVDGEGHVKLLDFGIAKAADDGDHTRTGVLKGKIRYMSPEQCNQATLDRRSDLYTLGIVMWELLAGERLFERQTELETMQAITAGALRDIRPLRPDVPEAVVVAMEKALKTQPKDRYPTADAMRRGLLEAAAESGLDASQDAAARFVDEILGAKLAARRHQIEARVENPRIGPILTLDPTRTASRTPSVTLGTESASWVGVAGVVTVVLAAAIALAAVAIAVTWSMQGDDGAKAETRPPDPPLVGPAVTVALAPVQFPATMVTELEPLRRWLEKQTTHPVRFLVATSYSEAGDLVASGRVGFALLPPYVYILSAEDHADVKPIAMELFDGSTGTDGVILVREDAPYSDVRDLIGKTVCLTDPESSTGYLLPRAWLSDHGVNPDKDIAIALTKNHYQAIKDLGDKKCEAAGTYSGAWMSAGAAGVAPASFRVLAITGRTPHDVFCAGKSADPAVVKQVTDALLSLDTKRDLGVDRIGDGERITGFVPVDDTKWNDLRKALASERNHK